MKCLPHENGVQACCRCTMRTGSFEFHHPSSCPRKGTPVQCMPEKVNPLLNLCRRHRTAKHSAFAAQAPLASPPRAYATGCSIHHE
eukprot:scaffold338148_cov18-Prasinocladus_malaysianus.AAC.1